jgi:hypothetical protein
MKIMDRDIRRVTGYKSVRINEQRAYLAGLARGAKVDMIPCLDTGCRLCKGYRDHQNAIRALVRALRKEMAR